MCFLHMYLVAAAVCFIGSVHSSLTKFQCSDSRCFSSTFLCDDIPDCEDQSDEKNCDGCDMNMFKCQNSRCIRAMLVCNGKDDCGDGSDELICGTCMFGCQNSRLVPADEMCDGFDDCWDGSDELNCVASTAKEAPPSTSTATATPSTASSTSTATATPSTASSTADQPSDSSTETPTASSTSTTTATPSTASSTSTATATPSTASSTSTATASQSTASSSVDQLSVIVEGQCNQTDGTYIHGKTTVAVHCDFTSNTFANLSVSCSRKGTEMSKSDRIFYETGRQRRNPGLFYVQFHFTPVLRRDRGSYSCKATAGQSSKAIAVSLLVYEVPTVTLSPSTLSLQEGDQRNFTCQVNNAPAVKTVPRSLVWCQADQVITGKSKIVRVRDGMEILMMNSSDRAGVYKCGVINCTETATLVITKPEDKVCTETRDTRGTVWPQTVSNTTMVLPCPGGFLGKVHRVCDVTGEWGEPNYINCVREEIAQIEEEVAAITEGTVSSEAVRNVLENLQKVTQNNDSSAGDLDKSIDIVDNIVAAVSGPASPVAVDTASVKAFVKVIDDILSVDTSQQDWQQVQKKNSTKAASLARSVTAFGLAAAESQTENEPLKLNSSTMVIEIAKITARDIVFPTQMMDEVKSSLRLSKENLNHTEKITYVAASYKTMAEFLLTNTSGGDASTKEVNSQILSLAVKIGGKKLSNLKIKINLDFQHLQGNYSDQECVYWTFDKSRWLTDGCTAKDVNSSYTSCECNHLTNFAILMSPGRHVSAKHLHHLKIISIVGCSLSIIGCVVTVLAHAWMWSHVRSSKSIILMNLCVALTCAYSVFLAGVERTENKAVCTAVAALLHYFFLAVFSLMLAQGVDIAVQVAVVFRKSSRLELVLPLAWGVPAVIVGISLGVTRLEGYGNDQFCWLTVTDGVLYAFVGPALFVILANVVIIAIIFRVLFSTRMMINKRKKEKIAMTVRSLCVLMPVLGVTWVFGVLAINEETVVFQYLFGIFNSLQGVLIFIMHCGLNREIIEGIRKTVARYESLITMSLPYSRSTDQSEGRRVKMDKTSTDIPTGCNSDDLVSPTMVEMSTLRNVEAFVSKDDANPSSLITEDIPTSCNSDDLVSPTMVEMSTLRNVEATQKSVSKDDANSSTMIKEG